MAPKKEALAAAEAELAVAMAVCCFEWVRLRGSIFVLRANLYLAILCLGIGKETRGIAGSTRKAR